MLNANPKCIYWTAALTANHLSQCCQIFPAILLISGPWEIFFTLWQNLKIQLLRMANKTNNLSLPYQTTILLKLQKMHKRPKNSERENSLQVVNVKNFKSKNSKTKNSFTRVAWIVILIIKNRKINITCMLPLHAHLLRIFSLYQAIYWRRNNCNSSVSKFSHTRTSLWASSLKF